MERTKNKAEEEEKEQISPLPETPEEPKEEEEVPEEKVVEAAVKEDPPTYVDPDPVIVWKKIGGGSLHLPKRLIPPGGTFKARLSEIPKAFRDVVQAQEELPTVPSVPDVKPVKSVYQVVPRGKSKNLFDVIGPNGKRMNDQPLAKAVAEHLIKELS